MPWTIWVAVVLVLGSFSPFGALIIFILWAPLGELFKNVQLWWPAAEIGNATGLKPQYVWPLLALVVPGILLLILAAGRPKNPLYKHLATLLLGFALAAAVSTFTLRGWAGV
jgi:hypothetical protein